MGETITREPDETSASFNARRAAKKMSSPALVSRVKKDFGKIKSALPYIKELRDRFAALPRGKANIAGCKTWAEFCEKRLHRTDRTIRRVLAEEMETSVLVEKQLSSNKETHVTVERDATRDHIYIQNPVPAERPQATIEVHNETHALDVIRCVHTADDDTEDTTDPHSLAMRAAQAVHYGRSSIDEAVTTFGVPSEEIHEKLNALPRIAGNSAEKEPEADTGTEADITATATAIAGKKFRKIDIRRFASASALDMELLEECILGLLPDDLFDNADLLHTVVLTLRRVAFELESSLIENRLGA
jgi:hypothetical protein